MRTALLAIWRYLRAFLIICLCLYAGNALAALLPVTIPGSIIGMLILFFLLAFQLVPPDWVRPGSMLLIRYMALLFVPISVGVMGYTELLSAQFGPIVISCVVSTFIVLLTVGVVADKLLGKAKGGADE
ncbi:CidA/LrgA family protein [Erwinia sp. CGal63]|uniref:CidA/LrgA family protein n=1 Tax=Erwinia sp. CGal63 TaxID=2919889 RepID=UPI003008FC3B